MIGCGAAAQRYYVPALRRHAPQLSALFLVDRQIDLARNLAAEVGAGEPAADVSEVLEKIDGAVIVLPNHLHYGVARELLDAGKHVLCEKPLAESGAEADDLVQRAGRQGVGLCVNNTRRMYPSFQKIRELIREGALGRLTAIRYVEGNEFGWNSETGFSVNPAISAKGVLNDIGPHVLDTICWWIGARPALAAYRDDSFGGPESVAWAHLQADGCSIEVFLNRLVELESGFRIEGEKGWIAGGQYDWKKVRLQRTGGASQDFALQCPARTYPEFVLPIFENFLEVIQGRAEALIPGAAVADSIHLIDECYRRRERLDQPWNAPSITVEGEPVRTLVTGATGSIGGRVVELLHLSGKRIPVAAIRQWGTAARIGRLPVEIRRIDLMNPESIGQALEGITEIVHCAKGTPEVTVAGTRNLLAAAAQHPIRRVVHMSTAEVYGNVSGTVAESAPLQYTGDDYNRMKVDAEKICWEYIAKGLPIAILRPSIVYGPFSKNWSTRFAKLLIAGKWGVYEKYGQGKCNLIYVDDLVQAIACALSSAAAPGQAFNIVHPVIGTWNEYFAHFNAHLGLPPLKIIHSAQTLSKSAVIEPVRVLGRIVRDHFMEPVRLVADRIDLVKTLLKYTEAAVKSTPSPGEFQLFNREMELSPAKSQALLGFTPAHTLDRGLALTATWVRVNGLSPQP
ncbi:MAG: NAD-dependent epimerase/dehydratase family protein [Lentisphaeria bacterium]|nr:NAD-dependent epimerase/dehydratase family protein [Lentisphaeria bacterium]